MHKSSERVTLCVPRKSINHRGGGCRIFAKGWSGVVIFTALVTLESPGLPSELDMAWVNILPEHPYLYSIDWDFVNPYVKL